MEALRYLLPAAAGLVYLNGRHALTYDWELISSLISSRIQGLRHERNDAFNLFYMLEQHAHSSRVDHTWIIFMGRRYTYGQAYELVLKYGTWLKSKGIRKDEIVAMDFANSEVFVWVWFGLWSIGAKPAFINYNLTGQPLLHSIRTSSARIILVDEDGRDKFSEDVMTEYGFVSRPADNDVPEGRQAKYGFESAPEDIPFAIRKRTRPLAVQNQAIGSGTQPERRKLEIVFFDKGLETYIESLEPIRQPDSERSNQKAHDMAMLIYTSGTTGLPKPAVMAWGKANLGSKYVANWIPLKKADIMYTSMPLYHSSASVLGVCSILQAGSTICLSKKFSHKTFWPEVRSSKATIIHYVGETCRYLLSAPQSDLDKKHNVRAAFGNGLRPDVWEAFKKRFNIPTILEFYAATEAPAGMWNRSTNSFSAGAIGRNGTLASLLMESSLTIVNLDPHSDPLDPIRDPITGLCKIADWDEPGELLYKLDADNISLKFQGYFGNSKATDSKVLRDVRKKGDAYFRTGDLMRWDKEGRWWFVDRTGDTFRWKAENVSTTEVAEALGKHESIEEATVYGVLVPRHDGRAGCAAVVFKNANNASPDASLALPHPHVLKSLAEHLQKSLPAFAVPLFLRITQQIHATGTNKQQKHVFQKDGIDMDSLEKSGDVLFWLQDGTYKRFTRQDFDKINGGNVKL